MKMHWIEIDDRIWQYLQKHAEPFVDTPNSVLYRLLFGDDKGKKNDTSPPISIRGLPKSLTQIFEVLYEMERHGYSRVKATNIVAQKRGTVPQTIMDKYCKQLNLKAHEVDLLLAEPDYSKFKKILKNKFPIYSDVTDAFFESLVIEDYSSSREMSDAH